MELGTELGIAIRILIDLTNIKCNSAYFSNVFLQYHLVYISPCDDTIVGLVNCNRVIGITRPPIVLTLARLEVFHIGHVIERLSMFNAPDEVRVSNELGANGDSVRLPGQYELFAFFRGDARVDDHFRVRDEGAV